MCGNFVHATNDASDYTKPTTVNVDYWFDKLIFSILTKGESDSQTVAVNINLSVSSDKLFADDVNLLFAADFSL